ncbi:response regulator [Dictyobacter aurantiacus]|uniref:response regulator n=1 Tax=Dictyobacter aurantiacus TaxID=1936993 RepID=UPI001F48E428|nr:response regulator [Dictyobacter aurantiacus]
MMKDAKKRVLVINDTEAILDLFRVLLEEEGFEVFLSSYPMQKTQEIEHIQPDLIILDFIYGSQKSGWQMLQMLKMYRPTSHIPIIICTTAIDEVQEQEGYLSAQGVKVVYKPFDIDSLLLTIKQVFKTSSSALHNRDI